LTLEGAIILPRQGANHSFYGAKKEPRLSAWPSSPTPGSAAAAAPAAASAAARRRRGVGREAPPQGWAAALLSGSEPRPLEAVPLYDALLDAFGGTDADALADAFAEADIVQ
jgi:hypothetical protein